MEIKYPDIEVQLTGRDGNAYAILGLVSTAMRRAGLGEYEINAFLKEAKSGDYDHLLATAMRTVNVT